MKMLQTCLKKEQKLDSFTNYASFNEY